MAEQSPDASGALTEAEVGAAIVALGKASLDAGDRHQYNHAVAALRAGDSTACVDGRCVLDSPDDAPEPAAATRARAKGLAVERERIAQAIVAGCEHRGGRHVCIPCWDAARIARSES